MEIDDLVGIGNRIAEKAWWRLGGPMLHDGLDDYQSIAKVTVFESLADCDYDTSDPSNSIGRFIAYMAIRVRGAVYSYYNHLTTRRMSGMYVDFEEVSSEDDPCANYAFREELRKLFDASKVLRDLEMQMLRRLATTDTKRGEFDNMCREMGIATNTGHKLKRAMQAKLKKEMRRRDMLLTRRTSQGISMAGGNHGEILLERNGRSEDW